MNYRRILRMTLRRRSFTKTQFDTKPTSLLILPGVQTFSFVLLIDARRVSSCCCAVPTCDCLRAHWCGLLTLHHSHFRTDNPRWYIPVAFICVRGDTWCYSPYLLRIILPIFSCWPFCRRYHICFIAILLLPFLYGIHKRIRADIRVLHFDIVVTTAVTVVFRPRLSRTPVLPVDHGIVFHCWHSPLLLMFVDVIALLFCLLGTDVLSC